MQKKYHGWTEGERTYILSAARRSGPKINWIHIQKNLPHRTVQQCKSFYNNRVKQYQLERLLPKTSLTSYSQDGLEPLVYRRRVSNQRPREASIYRLNYF
ncbi:SANT/Myb_domain [Hexamita inflata]|uniref:SANT/Myb domain n=1 Tax=Hexamita inflata TaxID=28002 RepID=A0AA86NST9_9EUKA|nr:SANT/Myb domain [Hexamita inflata]